MENRQTEFISLASESNSDIKKHKKLKPDDRCPECKKGLVIEILKQVTKRSKRGAPERLRCIMCGQEYEYTGGGKRSRRGHRRRALPGHYYIPEEKDNLKAIFDDLAAERRNGNGTSNNKKRTRYGWRKKK